MGKSEESAVRAGFVNCKSADHWVCGDEGGGIPPLLFSAVLVRRQVTAVFRLNVRCAALKTRHVIRRVNYSDCHDN